MYISCEETVFACNTVACLSRVCHGFPKQCLPVSPQPCYAVAGLGRQSSITCFLQAFFHGGITGSAVECSPKVTMGWLKKVTAVSPPKGSENALLDVLMGTCRIYIFKWGMFHCHVCRSVWRSVTMHPTLVHCNCNSQLEGMSSPEQLGTPLAQSRSLMGVKTSAACNEIHREFFECLFLVLP